MSSMPNPFPWPQTSEQVAEACKAVGLEHRDDGVEHIWLSDLPPGALAFTSRMVASDPAWN